MDWRRVACPTTQHTPSDRERRVIFRLNDEIPSLADADLDEYIASRDNAPFWL
jgi:hypothetical protein